MKNKLKSNIDKIGNKPIVRKSVNYLKEVYDKTIETNSQLQIQFLQFLPFLVASFITGFVAFLYSQLFKYAETWSFYLYNLDHRLIFIVTPISFFISWYLVARYAPYAKGSGIPQVMASLELTKPKDSYLIDRFLSMRIIVVKILSSMSKVIGGGIAGREGPTIQISSSIFNQIYKWLPEWWIPISQKNILIAGAASGLAAAFNTPLGGIIFAIEELSKYHINSYRSPLFIAVIIAGLTAAGFGGSYLYLGYPHTQYSGYMVYLGIIIVSIVAGVFGAQMCNLIMLFINFVQKYKKATQQMLIVLASSLFVATFIYLVGEKAMGSGKEVMEQVLFTDNKTVDWYLPFVRMNGLIVSFGFGGAGGVFAPSLTSGACFGSLIAQWMQLTGDNANLIILIGMTGFLTAVTRAPFTSAIIVFEMTDRHSIIFFLLFGALISSIFASFINKHSLYDILKVNYIQKIKSYQKAKAKQDAEKAK